MRLLLIAALLLQGFVLALGSGAVAPAPAMAGCGCSPATQASSCCPSGAGEQTTGCGAALGAALCACTSESSLPTQPLQTPPARENGPERTISSCAATIAPMPASSQASAELVAHTMAPHAPHSHQQVRALLGTWRS